MLTEAAGRSEKRTSMVFHSFASSRNSERSFSSTSTRTRAGSKATTSKDTATVPGHRNSTVERAVVQRKGKCATPLFERVESLP